MAKTATRNSVRAVIGEAVDIKALAAQADSVVNDGMQALALVLRKRDLPGGLRDSRQVRAAFHAIVIANITEQAGKLIADLSATAKG